jgi:ribosome-binding factor A
MQQLSGLSLLCIVGHANLTSALRAMRTIDSMQNFKEQNRRQKKVGSMLQQELAGLFQRNGSSWYGPRAFVTISGVWMSPDLHTARFYLSVFNVENKEAILESINQKSWDIRQRLGRNVRHQLRKVPELEFFLDESLDNVFHMEEVFKDL